MLAQCKDAAQLQSAPLSLRASRNGEHAIAGNRGWYWWWHARVTDCNSFIYARQEKCTLARSSFFLVLPRGDCVTVHSVYLK